TLHGQHTIAAYDQEHVASCVCRGPNIDACPVLGAILLERPSAGHRWQNASRNLLRLQLLSKHLGSKGLRSSCTSGDVGRSRRWLGRGGVHEWKATGAGPGDCGRGLHRCRGQ
ncbi:unnamed protein product, partial [Laminaria digitata]